MIIFYHLFLWFYRAGIFLVSFFNPKARSFIKGRVNILNKVRDELSDVDGKVVWMHCASLGEFEQGKPVMKRLMAEDPSVVPVISFFSPSGYEIVKKKKEFEYIYYLPVDSYLNARQWMNIVKPSLVLWVKYEYWYFYLTAIKRKNVPLLMVSGIYRRNQVFFKWYGGLYRKMLGSFTHFFVQNISSKRYLSTLISKEKISVSGDTRCDRVIEIAQQFQPIESIDRFVSGHKTIVCGSTWEGDEAVWVHYINTRPEIRFIVAPHEISRENIMSLKKKFTSSISYTEWTTLPAAADANCLIIDNIGMLSKLYHYADVTYVGGGFSGNGLHNILEAAVYGKPVLFGPAISKNFEASELIIAGGGIMVSTALELEEVVEELIKNPDLAENKGRSAAKYIFDNAGASETIVRFITEKTI